MQRSSATTDLVRMDALALIRLNRPHIPAGSRSDSAIFGEMGMTKRIFGRPVLTAASAVVLIGVGLGALAAEQAGDQMPVEQTDSMPMEESAPWPMEDDEGGSVTFDLPTAPVAAGSRAEILLNDALINLAVIAHSPELELTGVQVSEPISVTENDGTLTLTLPNLEFLTEDTIISLGTITLDETPIGDGKYDFSFGIPEQIKLVDLSNWDNYIQIDLANPAYHGTWREVMGADDAFLSIDGMEVTAMGPEFGSASGSVFASTGPINLTMESAYTSETIADIPLAFSIADISFLTSVLEPDSPYPEPDIHVGHIGLDMFFGGVNVVELEEAAQNLRASYPSDLNDKEALAALHQGMGELITDMNLDKADYHLSFSDINVGTPTTTDFALSDFGLSFGFVSGETPEALDQLMLGISGEGLTIAEAEEEVPAEMWPEKVNLQLHIDRMPVRQIGRTIIPASIEAQGAADPEMALADAVSPDMLMGMIMQAQPLINIEDLSFGTQLLDLAGTGSFMVDPQSSTMMTGDAEVVLAGLDETQAFLQEFSKTEPEAQEAIPLIMMIKGLGTAQGDGSFLYKLVVDDNPNGPTINGQPLMGLMGSAPPQSEPGRAPESTEPAPAQPY